MSWDPGRDFGRNAVIRPSLAPDGWVDRLDILYGPPGGPRVGPRHGHMVMGPDGDVIYNRTLDQKVTVDKK
jgi:hypothetical protein